MAKARMKEVNMKKIIALLLAGTLVLSITACGNQTDSTTSDSGSESGTEGDLSQGDDKPVSDDNDLQIEFFQQKNESAAQEAYLNLIDKFNEENPGVTISMVTVPDAPQVLNTRLAAGDIPDIFSDFPTDIAFKNRIEGGYYMDLTGQSFLDNINQGMLDMSVAPDGKYYAMPFSQNFMAVYYNMDKFEEYNLNVPTTWDAFMDVCQTLKDNGEQVLDISCKDTLFAYMYYGMLNALNPNGVHHLVDVVEDTTGNLKVSDDEGFRLVGEKMLKLSEYFNDDAFSISHSEALETFANNGAAMTVTGSFSRGTISSLNPDLNFGIFPLPPVHEGEGKILAGVDAAICISGKISEEKREAALKFLDFLSQTENAQSWSDKEGAPSCVKGTTYGNDSTKPVVDMLNEGQTLGWPFYFVEQRFTDTPFMSAIQTLVMEKDVDAYLDSLDSEYDLLKSE